MTTPSEKLQSSEVPNWLDVRMPRAEQELRDMVAINSFTPNTDGVNRMQEHNTARLRDLGLEISQHRMPDRGMIVTARSAAAVAGEPATVLVVHADTVHPPESMSHELIKRDGKLYGPGAYDMKAGIVVVLLALEALEAAGVLSSMSIKVVSNSAEEDGSPATKEFMSKCAEHARAALVFEFGRDGGNIVTSRKGCFSGAVELTGKSAHAGNNPLGGISAIREMGKILTDLPDLVQTANASTSFNWGTVHGGTATNVIAAGCKADFEVRSNTVAGLELAIGQVTGNIAAFSGKGKVALELGHPTMPLEETAASKELAAEYIAAGKLAGLSLSILPRSGGLSDANHVAKAGVPVIDALGPEGNGAHTPDEHVIARSIYDKALTLIHFLLARAPLAA